MPRFFFDVEDGCSLLDAEGTELPDVNAAQAEAIRFSGEVLRDMGARFWTQTGRRLNVRDERGRVLFALRFSGEAFPADQPEARSGDL